MLNATMLDKERKGGLPAFHLTRGLFLLLIVGGLVMFIVDEKLLSVNKNDQRMQQDKVPSTNASRPVIATPPTRKPDAIFGGQPLYLVHRQPPNSRVQCVSENFQGNAWLYRSCRFDYLCFDVETKEFVLHPSLHHQQLEEHSSREKKTFLSSEAAELMGGGAHAYWLQQGRGKWKPTIRNATNVTSYYMLSDDTVWISYFPLGDCNVGHQLWDNMLPIYTLLEIFGWTSPDTKLFLTTMPRRGGRQCDAFLDEFLPLMLGRGHSSLHVTTSLMIEQVAPHLNGSTSSTLVCAKHAASGMGWLTDHGLQQHDSQPKHALNPVNVGRGPNFRSFRNYVLRNGNMLPQHQRHLRKPLQVTFSILSSHNEGRRLDFGEQARAVRDAFGDRVRVERIAMWNYTLREQVEIVANISIFISTSGGGTAPAFFLPKGSSLILYDRDNELDWDLWNNYADLRVHWVGEHVNNTDYLVDLVRDELETIEESLSRK